MNPLAKANTGVLRQISAAPAADLMKSTTNRSGQITKRAITLAALAKASTGASADKNNTNIDVVLHRPDMPNNIFVQQSMTAVPGATGIINFAGIDVFSVAIEGDRVEITAVANPSVLDSTGAGTALDMIDFIASDTTYVIRSADIAVSRTPTNWADAAACPISHNGVYVRLNSAGSLAPLERCSAISVDLGFDAVSSLSVLSILGLTGCAALRRCW